MTECDADIFYVINEKAATIFQRIYEERDKTLEWFENYKAAIRTKLSQNENFATPFKLQTSTRQSKTKRPVIETTSEDEDSKLLNETSTESSAGKSKRNASKLAQLKINQQSQIKLNTKMRRPKNNESPLADISNKALLCIKKENIKSEPNTLIENEPPCENMPPPMVKPKRGRKKIKKEVESSDTETEKSETGRVTRSKRLVKKTNKRTEIPTNTGRPREDSDVIIQENAAPLIILLDSDNEDIPIPVLQKPQAIQDILEDFDTEDEEPIVKTTETKKKSKEIYEDAITDRLKNVEIIAEPNYLNVTKVIEKPLLNETCVVGKHASPALAANSVNCAEQELRSKNGMNLNCTVVLEKINETVTLNEKQVTPPPTDSLLTDDDSVVTKTPDKEPIRKGIKTKQMFSPYANSPVRKRVAAFEKLTVNEPPGRITRTKTRNMNNEKEHSNAKSAVEAAKAPAKAKFLTPTANNKLPSLIPQSDGKIGKVGLELPMKSQTAVKPSRVELQQRREEEQRKRLEKELEAKRKRDALIQAKADEQRRKREEKQLKAQKVREEMLREKEDKFRQMVKEKEEKLLEEQQRKREWNAKKLAEMEERKRLEEQKRIIKMKEQERLERQRLMEEKRKKQLATKPPPLPTDDLENSDDSSSESGQRAPYRKPAWARNENLYPTLRAQVCLPKSFVRNLFQMGAQTPDLREIFETIDERILRRNSSAVWNTPPRYSTLPKF